MDDYRVTVYISLGADVMEVEVDVMECNEAEAKLAAEEYAINNLIIQAGYAEKPENFLSIKE